MEFVTLNNGVKKGLLQNKSFAAAYLFVYLASLRL